MKQIRCAMVVAALAAAYPALAESVPAQIVVTAQPASRNAQQTLATGDLAVEQGKASVPVTRLERLSGNLSGMQLFVLLDDSTRSASLGTQIPELKKFLNSLPATTQVAVGYMRNGAASLAQPFTADHAKAAAALRLPTAIPGANASPYFALSDLVKHWPSKEPAIRRAVLMLTDGVDRYYSGSIVDDPYVDAAFHDALKQGVMVYSIYLRGAGGYGRGGWATTIAQSRLMEVSDETGGHAYFEALSDPVTISPFLNNLQDRMDNQYRVTFQAVNQKGFQPVKLKTEVPGIKVTGPTHIYVP
ncbi:MAG TPA: hypothetical protein VG456_06095 [Candidatus Sulfopaludibacter sp.]|nr:hypothetical protein [Candidatus Sulfopaludibacter sp.]